MHVEGADQATGFVDDRNLVDLVLFHHLNGFGSEFVRAFIPLMTPVIMDGEVLPENLRSVGKDEVWLTKKLREQGYSAFGEVFLALCDGSGEAPQLYPIETKKTPREDGK